MGETSDAIVIGGGVIGLCCAQQLIEQGLTKVILLEKRFVGAGSSGKSGAILRQHYSHRTTIGMARQSLIYYRAFQERYGHDIGFKQTPLIFLCHDDDSAALEANVALQTSLGVTTEILDPVQLRQLDRRAAFGDEVRAAYEPEAAYVDAGRTIHALASLCKNSGVDLRQDSAVTDVLLRGDRVCGVRIDGGVSIEAPVVINAGGPWAAILCRRLGLNLPLATIRPEQAYLMPPGEYGSEPFIYGDLLTGLYWKPEPAGWTRIGKMSYDGDEQVTDPDNYNEGVSDQFIESCRQGIAQRLPAYRNAVSWGGCGALYTVTPDAHALIGEVEQIRGFYLVAGFSGHGFKMAPAVGQGVAALVTGNDPGAFAPGFFAVDRFDKGHPIETAYRYGILG